MVRRSSLLIASAFSVLIAATACDYDSPTAPESSMPGPEGAVVSLTSTGLAPGAATITAGQSVTFVNNDSIAHEIVSGPAPSYDECPEINRVGRLEPGQSMQTGALSVARSCTFLDLLRISDQRWQGMITVQ
jgi:plastocyanin